jgi:hypothetical protein
MNARLKDVMTGAATFRDWLGSGLDTVEPPEANRRAQICSLCIKNQRGDWWSKSASVVADAIRGQIAAKHSAQLDTPFDADLGTCEVCLCNIPLLVWVPIGVLTEREYADRLEKYPSHCWKGVGIKEQLNT